MRPEVGGTKEEEGTKRHEPPGSCDKLIADPFAHVGQEQENRQRAEQGRDQPFDPQLVAREANAVVLSYWLAPSRSFVWVVKSSGVECFPLPSAKEIEGESISTT